MNTNRRSFLKTSLTASAFGVAVSAGLITPRAVLAAWPKAAFTATTLDTAIKGAFGSTAATNSTDIVLKAPEIAENGAVVPITVTSKIAGTESITLLIAKNPTPLTASFALGKGAQGFVSTRVKMSKTSDLVVIVKANGKLFSSKKEIKVTIGGCGG